MRPMARIRHSRDAVELLPLSSLLGRRVAIAEVERLRELVRFAHGKLAQKGAV
jgi:hypothetical protein